MKIIRIEEQDNSKNQEKGQVVQHDMMRCGECHWSHQRE